MGLMVFQEGVLKSRQSAAIGYAKVGLSELVSDATGAYLAARGRGDAAGRGRTGLCVGRRRGLRRAYLQRRGQGRLVRLRAAPPTTLPSMLPKPLADDDFFARARDMPYSPIVDVHVWYDRPRYGRCVLRLCGQPLAVGVQQKPE